MKFGSDRIGSLTHHQDTEGPHVLSSDFAVHAEPEEFEACLTRLRQHAAAKKFDVRRAHDPSRLAPDISISPTRSKALATM